MGKSSKGIEVLEVREDTDEAEGLVQVVLRGDRASLARFLPEPAPIVAEACEVAEVSSEPPMPREAKVLRRSWEQLRPGRRMALLALCGFVAERNQGLFCRAELEHHAGFLDEDERPAVTQRALIHLARKGSIERRKRGVYVITEAGEEELAALRSRRGLRQGRRSPRALDPEPRSKRRRSHPEPAEASERGDLPGDIRLDGISPFLRTAASATARVQTLMCAVFLRRYLGIEVFDRGLIEACFRRVRGLEAPRSLSGMLSQVLTREAEMLEPCEGRGRYRLTDRAYAALLRRPYIREAELRVQRIRPPVDEAPESLSNGREARASA